MKPYLTLDIITVILVVVGVITFYHDLSNGNFNGIITVYFIVIAIGYFFVMNYLHQYTKKIIKKVAENLDCEFMDEGKYSLTHFIKCKDMQIKINLRGSYVPSSMQITIYGSFNPADVKSTDKNSKKFIKLLNDLQSKYKIKVNDAYISKDLAEAIITKYPYDAELLEKIIIDLRKIISTV